MNASKFIFTLMLLITVLGSVNWGLVPSGNNLVERVIPTNYVSYTYYAIAFAGLVTLVMYTRMSAINEEPKKQE